MPGIVIHNKKQVYWPIPKCASTSYKMNLANSIGIKFTGNVHDAPFEWTKEPIDGYTNYAIVRNPYTRLLSLFNNKKHFQDGIIYRNYSGFNEKMDFAQFVDRIISIDDPDPHFDLQINQMPSGCNLIYMESLTGISIENESSKKDWYTHHLKTKVMKHYLPDFIKLGYEL